MRETTSSTNTVILLVDKVAKYLRIFPPTQTDVAFKKKKNSRGSLEGVTRLYVMPHCERPISAWQCIPHTSNVLL